MFTDNIVLHVLQREFLNCCFVLLFICVKMMDNEQSENTGQVGENIRPNFETLFLNFLERIDQRPSTSSMDVSSITLPTFEPGRDDPQCWTEDLFAFATELGWSDAILMSRISKCFSGETGEWFLNWNPVDRRTWENFKRDFCIREVKKCRRTRKVS